MNLTDLKKRLRSAPQTKVPDSLRDRLIETIPETFGQPDTAPKKTWFTRNRLFYLVATAAVLMIAVHLSVGFNGISFSIAAAAVAKVVKKLKRPGAYYIELDLRTRKGEPFEYIAPENDFSQVKIWLERPSELFKKGRMRIEKKERKLVYDGKKTLYHDIEGGEAHFWKGGKIDRQIADPVQWLNKYRSLAEADVHMDTAQVSGTSITTLTIREKGTDLAPGHKPAFFTEFDRKTVISWQTDTSQLTDLKRYVIHNGSEVLVAKLRKIVSIDHMEDPIFSHVLPEGTHLHAVADSDNRAYSKLGPVEVARRMFTAWQNGEWDTVNLFCESQRVIEYMRNNPLTRFTITGPKYKRNPNYPGYQVPYELVFESGRVKHHALSLRNDNEWNRYVWDGGL